MSRDERELLLMVAELVLLDLKVKNAEGSMLGQVELTKRIAGLQARLDNARASRG